MHSIAVSAYIPIAEGQVVSPPVRDPIICVEHLTNGFDGKIVHDDLNLDVHPGEILGVVGGSGTGKSVLMRSIIGLQKPLAGEIRVFGENIEHQGEKESADLRRRWGVLFQNGALFSGLSVAENIEVPMREFYDLPQVLMDEIAGFKTALVGLPPDAAAKYPSELSGGMVKRAALARALSLDPRLVFLDEPTSGLDPISAAAFDELILELKKTLGLTVFMITHDLDSLHAICDRVAVLAEKRVIAVGTIPELMRLDHPWIQSYFGGPRGRSAAAAETALKAEANSGNA